jgi:hypothetical protein
LINTNESATVVKVKNFHDLNPPYVLLINFWVIHLFARWWAVLVLVLMLMLIYYERKILLNDWLISLNEQGEYL